MKKLFLYLMAAACVAAPEHAGAWGKKGHQMVAELGYGMLDAKTKSQVEKYLGNISVADAGTWMDDMRNNPKYAYLKPWHFVNIDKGESYEPSDKDIVTQLDRAISNIRNRKSLSDAEIQLNLLVLFHLTGDIAQPMHVGYGSDMGGNSVDVTYLSKPSNLHKVWDSEIIEGERMTLQDCLDYYGTLPDEKIESVKSTDPRKWMSDSRKLLPRAYAYEMKEGEPYIDSAYIKRNKIVIRRQLVYAGIRLAATLESLFSEPVKTRQAIMRPTRGLDTITLDHLRYRSHFVNSAHIPWVVEYTLRKNDLSCDKPLKRTDKFAYDPYNKDATDLDKDYKGSGYDRGHNMPAANNSCDSQAMAECFYFSNMFPQTHRLNAGVWKTLEEQERKQALAHDSIYVWIGSYGVDKKIGPKQVVVPKYCWKVIYDYKTEEWMAYIFPNTTTVTGKPAAFETTVSDISKKSGFEFK